MYKEFDMEVIEKRVKERFMKKDYDPVSYTKPILFEEKVLVYKQDLFIEQFLNKSAIEKVFKSPEVSDIIITLIQKEIKDSISTLLNRVNNLNIEVNNIKKDLLDIATKGDKSITSLTQTLNNQNSSQNECILGLNQRIELAEKKIADLKKMITEGEDNKNKDNDKGFPQSFTETGFNFDTPAPFDNKKPIKVISEENKKDKNDNNNNKKIIV